MTSVPNDTHTSSMRTTPPVRQDLPRRSIDITWHNHNFTLLDDRAIYWPAQNTLLLADLHLGKASAFAAFGIPVPAKTNDHDLDRLTSLVDRTGAHTLVILGDLLHHKRGRCGQTLAAGEQTFGQLATRTNNPVRTILVRGNHDEHAGDPPASWRIRVEHAPLTFDGLTLVHDPKHALSDTQPDTPTLAGHLHPTVHTLGRSRCFWFTRNIGILPAFGTFTGGKHIDPAPGDRVFAIAPPPETGLLDVSAIVQAVPTLGQTRPARR